MVGCKKDFKGVVCKKFGFDYTPIQHFCPKCGEYNLDNFCDSCGCRQLGRYLLVVRCLECGKTSFHRHANEKYCTKCGSEDWVWVEQVR
jgi:uncharacterized OB-fold protein